MNLNYNSYDTFISTGGNNIEPHKPTICFIHGAGQNHFSFTQQTRYFANRGYNVISPDFPGHGFSNGRSNCSIEEDAKWLLGLLEEIGVEKFVLGGHSQGCLTALEISKIKPQALKGIIFIAGASKIPVNDFLIGKATEDPNKAYDLMVTWGHGVQGSFSISEWPGHHHLLEGNSVMRINDISALANDLNSCNNYEGGLNAAKNIKLDCLAVLARFDIMTPLKAGKKLVDAIKNCESHVLNCGHFLPAEKPKELNKIIFQYLKNLEK